MHWHKLHRGLGKAEAAARAVEMLQLVKIPEAERRGMRQFGNTQCLVVHTVTRTTPTPDTPASGGQVGDEPAGLDPARHGVER